MRLLFEQPTGADTRLLDQPTAADERLLFPEKTAVASGMPYAEPTAPDAGLPAADSPDVTMRASITPPTLAIESSLAESIEVAHPDAPGTSVPAPSEDRRDSLHRLIIAAVIAIALAIAVPLVAILAGGNHQANRNGASGRAGSPRSPGHLARLAIPSQSLTIGSEAITTITTVPASAGGYFWLPTIEDSLSAIAARYGDHLVWAPTSETGEVLGVQPDGYCRFNLASQASVNAESPPIATIACGVGVGQPRPTATQLHEEGSVDAYLAAQYGQGLAAAWLNQQFAAVRRGDAVDARATFGNFVFLYRYQQSGRLLVVEPTS